MSELIHKKIVHLEVKRRGPGDVEFVEPTYRLPNGDLPEWAAPGHVIDLLVTITSTHTYAAWSRAYARQGRADLKVYEELQTLRKQNKIEDCHELHYLQMALEKIARAFLLKKSMGDRRAYLLSHVAVSDFVSKYIASPEGKSRFQRQDLLWKQVKQLAGEVEHLTPAIERQARPRNVEYPWSDGRTVHVPTDVSFLKAFSFAPNVWVELASVLNDVSFSLVS